MAELTALAEALRRRRADYNQRFLRARHQQRRLDPDDFLAVLRGHAAPLVEQFAEHNGRDAELDAIVSALYDVCLQLTAQDLLGPGARVSVVPALFDQLLPLLAPLVAEQPGRVLAALSNAAYHLMLERAANPRCWINRLIAIAPRLTSVDALLQVGQIAAWRCGLAQYREGALELARQLEPDLLAALFDRPDADARQLLDELADPWCQPEGTAREKRLQQVARVGGFVGFDGPFAEPPEVIGLDERIYALDGRQSWLLFADGFGQVLKGQGSDLPSGKPDAGNHFRIDAEGAVSRGDHQAEFPQLAGWRSMACTESTLAVTLPHSHYLFLVALC